MKSILKSFAALSLAALTLASCDKEPKIVDFDIVGDFALTAEKGASNGWIPGDKLGVFVTSDGVTQANLAYTPSEVAEDNSIELPDGSKFVMYGEAVGNVALNPTDKAAGYKQGKHVIYAYCPYDGTATDLTAVPVPDITKQGNSIGSTDQSKYFCCSKKVYEGEYSVAPVDLGTLAPKYFELNTGGLGVDGDEGLEGKVITELIISADKVISQSGTYNLEEDKFNGEGSKTITVTCNLEISAGYFGLGTMDPVIFQTTLSPEEATEVEFTFTAKTSDGLSLTGKATPSDPWGLGMIGFNGEITLK